MAKIIFDIHWKELSDFTIQQAALLTMGVDPDDYAVTMLGDSELATVPFEDTVEQNDVLAQKIKALASAIRSGQFEGTEEHLDQYGCLDPSKTRISRRGLLAWWQQFGYTDVIQALCTQAKPVPPEVNSESRATSSPAVALTQESFSPMPDENLKLHYRQLAGRERGSRMEILENWMEIQKEYGAQASGQQVLRFLKRKSDAADKVPALKTIQNSLIELRKEDKIPRS